MSLILVLLLSVSVLLRVETSIAQNQLTELRARENARLALMIALGELQQNAGPDNRVTARAEILGDLITGGNRYWTGIWDTSAPQAGPTWLVSGDNPDPLSPNPHTLQVIGSGSASADNIHHVYAPSVEITKPNAAISDEISWWISDEATKASTGSIPINAKTQSHNFLQDELSEIVLASAHGLEEIFTDYDRSTSNAAAKLDLLSQNARLLEDDDFKIIENQAFGTEVAYHTLTDSSFGVLANVLPGTNGGLMRDLSLYPGLISPEFVDYIETAETNAKNLEELEDPIERIQHTAPIQSLATSTNLTDGQIGLPTAPILSNLMMAFTIRSDSPVASNPNFYLRMRFFCEFWNPYTSRLEMVNTDGEQYYIELEITGLPRVTMHKTTGSGASSAPVDIQNLVGDSIDGALKLRLIHNPNKEWLPGQTISWVGVDADENSTRSPYNSYNTDNKNWNAAENTLGGSRGINTNIPRLSGKFRHSSSGMTQLTVKAYLVNSSTGTRSLISEHADIRYESVSTRSSGYSNTHSGSTFGYHYTIRGPHYSSDDPDYFRGRWLYDHDPRNPKPIFHDDWNLDNDPDQLIGSPYMPVIDGLSPLLIIAPESINETDNTIDSDDFRRLLDRSQGTINALNALWQDAPLFEVPRSRPLSLASLQHLYFHNERPYQVGNSWGADGTKNTLKWFDLYYFSGFSRNDNVDTYDGTQDLPNPALTLFDTTSPTNKLTNWAAGQNDDQSASQVVAQDLLVKNRFNLNSTSIAAWKAVLGSLRINNWSYLDYPEDDTSNLSALTTTTDTRGGLFTRYSHSLPETYETDETPKFEGNGASTVPVAPSAFYRRGARYLTSTQLENLATEITNLLKQRGRPFFSMQEFLSRTSGSNTSLLETAIANTLTTNGRQTWNHEWETTGEITDDTVNNIEIDHFSPGFLTQADIMTAIGPMLAPRSDTFKIRVKAESFNFQNNRPVEAALEAIVQRTPELVDANTLPNGPAERKFKIIHIKWLSPEEI